MLSYFYSIRIALTGLLALGLAQSAWAKPSDTCNIAISAFQEASTLRHLKIRSQVPCEVHSKAQIGEFLRGMIKTKLPENKLAMEELVYKTVGVVPDDYNYSEGLVQLYLSQIGGYYDPEKKHYIMADWMPALLQTTVAVHELTHALQDQYFDLSKIIDPKLENGDLLLAHSALVEGDATAVMTDYTRKLIGQPPLVEEENINATLLQQVLGAGLSTGDSGAPEALKALMVFPYTSGLRFAFALLKKGGYAQIDKAFKKLPKTTEEILHPEIFEKSGEDYLTFSRTDIETDEVFRKEIGYDAKPAYCDVIGEFTISSALGSMLGNKLEGASAAAGWGGDLICIFNQGAKTYIAWKTNWDSEKDAQEFADAWPKAWKKSYGSTIRTLDEWTPLTPLKRVKLERSGTGVSLLFETKVR